RRCAACGRTLPHAVRRRGALASRPASRHAPRHGRPRPRHRPRRRGRALHRVAVGGLAHLGPDRRLRLRAAAARGGRREPLPPAGDLRRPLPRRRRVRARRGRGDAAAHRARGRVAARRARAGRTRVPRGPGLDRRRTRGARARLRDAARRPPPHALRPLEERIPAEEAARRHRFWNNFEARPTEEWAPPAARRPRPPRLCCWYRYVPTARFADPFVEAARALILVDTLSWPAVR